MDTYFGTRRECSYEYEYSYAKCISSYLAEITQRAHACKKSLQYNRHAILNTLDRVQRNRWGKPTGRKTTRMCTMHSYSILLALPSTRNLFMYLTVSFSCTYCNRIHERTEST